MNENILQMTPEEIFKINSVNFRRRLSIEEIEHIFKACGAFWHHPGEANIQAPHAKLTTGKHSNIYINCPLVLHRTNLCQVMAWQVIEWLREVYSGPIDWVVGSDSSALGLSKDVANLTGAKWLPMNKKKIIEDGKPKELQVWKGPAIKPSEKVLHVEELAVTSSTSFKVRRGIAEAHPDIWVRFIPFTPVLAFRPEKDKVVKEIDGGEFLPILYYETFVVDPKEKECPLCAQGSNALEPKGKNWDIMVDSMAA